MADAQYKERRTDLQETDIFDHQASLCLKGVAIIMMVIHHCFLDEERYAGQNLTFVIPESIWNYIALFFKICVCLFVFISAYGLTKKLKSIIDQNDVNGGADAQKKRISLSSFLAVRLVKLLGGFVFVFLLVDLFALFYDPGRFAAIYGCEFPACIEYFVIDLLGLAELFGTPTFLATYWYYTLAIVITVLAPVFYLLLKSLGTGMFLALVAIINFVVSFPNTNISHYILCIAVGVACADGNWITRFIRKRIYGMHAADRICKFVVGILFLFLLMVLREGPLKSVLYPFWDAVIPVAMTVFCCDFLFRISALRKVLMILGKYSADIFLIHNYIRVVWFYDFTYSFRYPLVIVTVLLAISLVISIGIELLKKAIHYDRLLNHMIQMISS